MLHAIPETDTIKNLSCFLLSVSGGLALNQERHANILDAVQRGDEIELLKNEPDVLRSKPSDGRFFHGAQIAPKDVQLPVIRLQGPGDDADESGLSTARGADEHGDVAAAHIEIDTLQHLKSGASVSKTAGDAAKPGGQLVLGIRFFDGAIGHGTEDDLTTKHHGGLESGHSPDSDECRHRTNEKNHAEYSERNHHGHVERRLFVLQRRVSKASRQKQADPVSDQPNGEGLGNQHQAKGAIGGSHGLESAEVLHVLHHKGVKSLTGDGHAHDKTHDHGDAE